MENFVIEAGILKKYTGDSEKNIVLTEGITEIGNAAFSCSEENGFYNSSIENIVIPEGVVKIGKLAFNWCTGIKNISIPESIEEIGACAFYKCEKLKEIAVSGNIKKIGYRAFGMCKELKSFTVTKSTDNITLDIDFAAVFGKNCEKLKIIYVPEDADTSKCKFPDRVIVKKENKNLNDINKKINDTVSSAIAVNNKTSALPNISSYVNDSYGYHASVQTAPHDNARPLTPPVRPVTVTHTTVGLKSGQRVSVSGAGSSAIAALTWSADSNVFIKPYVLILNNAEKGSPDCFTYDKKEPSGAIVIDEKNIGSNEIQINISRLSQNDPKIVIAGTVTDSSDREYAFSNVKNANVAILNGTDKREILNFDIGNETTDMRAVVFGEIYNRNGEWKFNAVGRGYRNGISELMSNYGLSQ